MLATAIDQPFYISFGHAAFFGIGAYTVGVLMLYGIDPAFVS